MGKPFVTLGLIATLFSPARAVAQAEPLLRVEGAIDTPLRLSPEEFAKFPRKTVRATDHGGAEAEFEGVPLSEIFTRAGAPLGERLRGEAMATYVVVKAADGYQAVFSRPSSIRPSPIALSCWPIAAAASPCPSHKDPSASSCPARSGTAAGCAWSRRSPLDVSPRIRTEKRLSPRIDPRPAEVLCTDRDST
jgi:hypothetical protein